MTELKKFKGAYKTIGEVCKELGLIDKKNGNLKTYTIRYWETQFKQIKPSIGAGKRRYYSKENFELIKSIMFLLKEEGLTINGVKKILNKSKSGSIDGNIESSVYKANLKNTKDIKNRLKKITKIINDLKKL